MLDVIFSFYSSNRWLVACCSVKLILFIYKEKETLALISFNTFLLTIGFWTVARRKREGNGLLEVIRVEEDSANLAWKVLASSLYVPFHCFFLPQSIGKMLAICEL